MNRNHYCCQRCGNLKYDWSGNLCPECLEKDRLRREGKKYFGMSIKMREATKEENRGVDEYIKSISEKTYTKNEVVAMFTELQSAIQEVNTAPQFLTDDNVKDFRECVDTIIKQKINSLKENTDGNK